MALETINTLQAATSRHSLQTTGSISLKQLGKIVPTVFQATRRIAAMVQPIKDVWNLFQYSAQQKQEHVGSLT